MLHSQLVQEVCLEGVDRSGVEYSAGARRDLRFTQSYVEALGREKRHAWSDPGIRSAQALKLVAFNFTGATEF